MFRTISVELSEETYAKLEFAADKVLWTPSQLAVNLIEAGLTTPAEQAAAEQADTTPPAQS